MGEVLNLADLGKVVADLKSQGKTIVSTNGCFDILHVGHVRFLKAAKKFGDVLIVGMNTDSSVRKIKGNKEGPPRPLNNEQDRAEILSSLGCVDYVVHFSEETPVELLKVIQPHVHCKGADYKPSDLAETPVVESFGGRMEIIELVPDRSTTALVSKMCAT